MTNEEIIEMAKQAGWEMDDSLVLEPEIVWYISQGQLEAFAKLVAQKERNECLKICDEAIDFWVKAGLTECAEIKECMNIAEEIMGREKYD